MAPDSFKVNTLAITLKGEHEDSHTVKMATEQEKPTLKSLMKASRDSNEELTSHINKKNVRYMSDICLIQSSLTKNVQSLSTLSEQVQETEARVGANEGNIMDRQSRINKMVKEISFLKEKANRSWR